VALTTQLAPVTPMRSAIARRMQASKQEAPHFYVSVEIAMDDAIAEVGRLSESSADGPRVSMSAVLVRACALALHEHPSINAVWTPDGLALAHEVNVCVAITLDGGLVAPAILNADQLDVLETSHALRDLIERSRRGKLRGAELSEGTFTLSNLGMFKVLSFAAIVTPPQVAVLAAGTVEPRLRWSADGAVSSSILTVTLSSDHRALDGVDAARFLGTLRELLEKPAHLMAISGHRPSPEKR
jgi:pyruvate dehydrogenase E2 component (dihydrolipoamide acetyltransferase)